MTKNFIDVAYDQGMIQSKIFSIAGTSNSLDQDNSTITFGGYRDEDITGDISYYDSFYSANSWSIKMDSFDLSGNENAYFPTPYEPYEIDLTDGKPTIAHFNSSYPFLGVDEETYDEFKKLLDQAETRSYVSKVTWFVDNNPWNLEYFMSYKNNPCNELLDSNLTL